MTPSEYIDIRLTNGKICNGYRLENGKRVRTEPNSKLLPFDMRFITSYGKNMRLFWENANSQSSLLWILRGLGRDDDADVLWNALALKYNLTVHHTIISTEAQQLYADEVRVAFDCPKEFE